MVIDDYGKRTYIKILELEKRIEKIENQADELKVNKLTFDFEDTKAENFKKKEFSFTANKEGRYVVDGVIWTDLLTLSGVNVKIFVNGVLATNFINNIDVELPFSFETAFTKGENIVLIELSAQENFSLFSLNISLTGFFDYIVKNNRLSTFKSLNCDYVLHLLGNEGMLMTYNFSTGLVHTATFPNVKDMILLGEDNEDIDILYTDLNNNLMLKKIDLQGQVKSDVFLNVKNVSSIASSKIDGGFKIYFSALAEIYEGEYFYNGEFSYRSTGRKGVKVYADYESSNCYIVVDRFNNAKFIT